ncbi:MAG: trimeric intracellular cation channel family protein [Aggregatilineales bacterium]
MTQLLYILDIIGVIVFAFSAVLTAKRARLDIFGALVVALITALGGGTTRDVLLGRTPVFWIQNEMYLLVIIPAAIISFYLLRNQRPSRLSRRILLTLDALGLAVFTVIGAEIARSAGVPPIVIVLLAVMTGTFGGIIRDVFLTQLPVVLHREIYATASLSGAMLYTVLSRFPSIPLEAITLLSITLIFTVRMFSIRRRWSLPVLQE